MVTPKTSKLKSECSSCLCKVSLPLHNEIMDQLTLKNKQKNVFIKKQSSISAVNLAQLLQPFAPPEQYQL